MKAERKIATTLTLTLCLAFGQACFPALADNDNMRLGVSEYNSGAYSEALGHLQAALATDFQNPKLHYYLANTFVHLNSKEAGIREFRIAYALDPDKEVGKLSKQALSILGADDSKPKEISKPLEKKPPSDPVLDKLNATLQQQAEQARNLDRGSNDLAGELARRNQELLGKAKIRHAKRHELLPPRSADPTALCQMSALKQLDNLKRMYEAQKSSYLDGSAKHSDEIQKSADNLAGLLNERGKTGSPKLVPEGTNLYIRNYKNEQGTSSPPVREKTSPISQTQSQTQPQSSTSPAGK